MKKLIIFALIAIFLLVQFGGGCNPSSAGAFVPEDDVRIAPTVLTNRSLIVYFKDENGWREAMDKADFETAQEAAKKNSTGFLRSLEDEVGCKLGDFLEIKYLWVINGLGMKVDPPLGWFLVSWIKARGDVERVEYSGRVTIH